VRRLRRVTPAEAAFQGLNGKIAFGRNPETRVPAAQWIPVGSMAVPRAGSATATNLPSGLVLVAGANSLDSRAELYDPQSQTFNLTAGLMVTGRGGAHSDPPSQREGADRGWAGCIRQRDRERRALRPKRWNVLGHGADDGASWAPHGNPPSERRGPDRGRLAVQLPKFSARERRALRLEHGDVHGDGEHGDSAGRPDGHASRKRQGPR
jgi:hypothetical protein